LRSLDTGGQPEHGCHRSTSYLNGRAQFWAIVRSCLAVRATTEIALLKFKTYQDSLHWTSTQASTGGAPEIEAAKSAKLQLERTLSALLLSENLVVLTGSGTSLCVKDTAGNAIAPTMGQLWTKLSSATPRFGEILTKVHHPSDASGEPVKDIEMLLSRCQIAVELIADTQISDFIVSAEKMISSSCNFLDLLPPNSGLPTHEAFLRKIARRPVRLPRTKLFTTNYDLCFETAASRAGYVLIDGFSHTLPQSFEGGNFTFDLVRREGVTDAPIFASNVLQFLKLHGSVDWHRENDGTVSRRQSPAKPVMIYPKSAKFKSSYEQPYFEMMSRFQTALRVPNTGVLIVGFGYNDSHLVGPIDSALRTNASLRLLTVGPSYESTLPGLVAEMNKLIEAGDRRLTLLSGTFEDLVEIVPDLTSVSEEELHQSRIKGMVTK